MKRLFIAILTLLAVVASAATHLYVDLNGFNAVPASNRWVDIQYLSPFAGNLTRYTSSTPAGGFWLSNVGVGDIRGTILQKGTANSINFQLYVAEDDTGLIYSSNRTSVLGTQTYPQSGRTAWSIQASDARYAKVGSGGLAYTPQPASANLTNWGELDTNILSSISGGSTYFLGSSNVSWTTTGGSNVATVTAKVPSATISDSATNWGTMESLLNPPHIGVPRTSGNYATAGNNSGFCYLSGSGIVRALWCVPVIGLQWTNSPTPALSIQCYVDIGSNTNPPTAALKAWEIPIKDLMLWNYRFTSNGNYAVNWDSRFLSVCDASTNILMTHPVRTFTLKAPIYFTNGILFRITNTVSANNTWTNGYFITSYESGSLTGPYQNYRLRSLRYSGAITASTSNHLGSISIGSGLIIGTLQSAVAAMGTGDFVNFTDSHGVRITQGSTFWEMNGDDQFNSTYAMVRGPFSELDYGCPNVFYDTSADPVLTLGAESYRWFYQDHMQFTNGFTSSVAPNGALADYKFNLFYYAQ